uniref:helix-turn-helix transcriptional regulator n=1 Tax=Endozoicomonas sp. Mp262 TaxID=2919499 RepID=UPI00351B7DD5
MYWYAMEKVKAFLDENDCTVTRLAKMARIPQSALHRAVTGERPLSGNSALKLSQVLGVHPLDLRPDLRLENLKSS